MTMLTASAPAASKNARPVKVLARAEKAVHKARSAKTTRTRTSWPSPRWTRVFSMIEPKLADSAAGRKSAVNAASVPAEVKARARNPKPRVGRNGDPPTAPAIRGVAGGGYRLPDTMGVSAICPHMATSERGPSRPGRARGSRSTCGSRLSTDSRRPTARASRAAALPHARRRLRAHRNPAGRGARAALAGPGREGRRRPGAVAARPAGEPRRAEDERRQARRSNPCLSRPDARRASPRLERLRRGGLRVRVGDGRADALPEHRPARFGEGGRGGGLPHLRWHDLRHLAASALIAESEGDVDHVSRVLGHASASITQSVYAHEFEKVERRSHARADGGGLREHAQRRCTLPRVAD